MTTWFADELQESGAARASRPGCFNALEDLPPDSRFGIGKAQGSKRKLTKHHFAQFQTPVSPRFEGDLKC
jgi:hypothetical protein